MATTKTRYPARHKWYYGPFENPHAASYEIADKEQATATFNRVRPMPLTPTGMRVQKTRYNPTAYDDHAWTGFPAFQRALLARVQRVAPDADDLLRASASASKDFYSDLDLGETLGEWRETSKMVHDGVKALYDFSKDVRRYGMRRSLEFRELPASFDVEGLKRLSDTKSAANAYLAMKFGWMQLAEDAYNAVSGALTRSEVGSIVRGRGRSSLNQDKILGKGNAGVRVYLEGRVSNANLRDLNRLGLMNPVRTAWQLTRLSFVADWWLGLANALGYYTWNLGLSETWNTVTTASVTESIYVASGVERSWQTTTNIDRTSTRFPIPWVGLVPSDPRVDLNIGKSITLAALLRQMS